MAGNKKKIQPYKPKTKEEEIFRKQMYADSLELAKESKGTSFKIIAKVNSSGMQLQEWCDEAYNFSPMCSNIKDDSEYKNGIYLKRTYTLEELPNALKNANTWHNNVKKNLGYNLEDLVHILKVL
jgi:hypothetical protein